MQIQFQMQGVPTADLREPGGAWKDEDTTSPGRQRGLSQKTIEIEKGSARNHLYMNVKLLILLLVVVGIILLNVLIHDCQKILEMDCLIDQLGQSKKAKQGPLKVQIIHLEMDRHKDEP